MWLNCNSSYINFDHVDYISFAEEGKRYKATVFFESGDTLIFVHEDLEALRNYFSGVFNDKRAEVG